MDISVQNGTIEEYKVTVNGENVNTYTQTQLTLTHNAFFLGHGSHSFNVQVKDSENNTATKIRMIDVCCISAFFTCLILGAAN